MNFKYSVCSGLGISSFEERENNDEDLLNGGPGWEEAEDVESLTS